MFLFFSQGLLFFYLLLLPLHCNTRWQRKNKENLEISLQEISVSGLSVSMGILKYMVCSWQLTIPKGAA